MDLSKIAVMEKELTLFKAKSMNVEGNSSQTAKPEVLMTTQVLAPQQPKKAYVIFSGSNKGVYTTYPQGVSDRDIVKEYPSEFEARYLFNQQENTKGMNDYLKAAQTEKLKRLRRASQWNAGEGKYSRSSSGPTFQTNEIIYHKRRYDKFLSPYSN